MTRMRTYNTIALGFAFVLALMPGVAFASDNSYQLAEPIWDAFSGRASAVQTVAVGAARDVAQIVTDPAEETQDAATPISALSAQLKASAADGIDKAQAAAKGMPAKTDKVLSYDPADIAAIGTQEESGHSICCPSFSCAYADAVMDGTVNDHDYYSCSCCSWTDWGGGDSSYRCVGDDEELLREAYDQIAAGKPTVIHVSWEGGEHWIALIGYENADDPDHLTLSNFIALDPWDGAQLNAGSKYDLYGDGCEHISDR